MLEVEQLDRTRLAECQGRRLSELLQKISGRNQFYTRKFRDAGVDVVSLRLPEDFRKLPLTTKAELNADQAANPPWGTALTEPLKKSGGRGNTGRVTVRFRGGGHKRLYRVIDCKRDKLGVPATVAAIEYDPNRSARIAMSTSALHTMSANERSIRRK